MNFRLKSGIALLLVACLGTACASGSSAGSGQNRFPTARPAGSAYLTPTPDSPHAIPTLRSQAGQYQVQSGDTLASIATAYSLSANSLAAANGLASTDWLTVGQVLVLPAPQVSLAASNFKIIPDSELVYGPVSSTLNIAAFVQSQAGYLSRYTEVVENVSMSGAEIIGTLAKEYSVNPRLLLALLEYQSSWVTQTQPNAQEIAYPYGLIQASYQGLYFQCSWAANELNRGFYLWGANALAAIQLSDGNLVPFPATLNAGTVSVQRFFALLDNASAWTESVSQTGLYATFARLFGLPFDLAIEPLLPVRLQQPKLQLPFVSGDVWSMPGGPHSAWGDGAAWAALDFAPPGTSYGCYDTDTWEVAVANGLIVRSENGEVVLDLDGDGLEQTGWTVLYMHVAARDRVAVGTLVKAGDHIGHPSCEGGVSNGTHLHLARRYIGVWIAADGNLPFVLDNWTSHGSGTEYDGTLTRSGQTVTAWNGRIADNQIQR